MICASHLYNLYVYTIHVTSTISRTQFLIHICDRLDHILVSIFISLFFFHSTNHQSEAVSSPAPETAPVPPPQSLVSTQAPLAPKRTRKRKKSEPSLAPASSDGDFLVGQHSQLPDQVMEQFYINLAQDVSEGVFGAPAQLYAQELVDMNAGLADTLPPAPEDNTVTEVYYYYPDGTFELAIPEPLANVQT